MGVYLLLTTLTSHGRETLHANPERIDAVNAEVERFGCQVLSQYALLGQFDFVTLVEAPDNKTMAQLSVNLGSRGTISIQTFPAISIDSLEAKLKGPQQLAAASVKVGAPDAPSDSGQRF